MSRFPLVPSESREVRVGEQEFVVRRYGIVSTPTVVYEAWEVANGHATTTHTDDRGWLGKVTSRPLPAQIAALPGGSQERIAAVANYLRDLRVLAVRAIEAAYPDVLAQYDARVTVGRVETRENDPDVSAVAASRDDRDVEAMHEFGGGR